MGRRTNPMSALKKTIEDLASTFATNVIAALRGASLEELITLTSKGTGGGGGGGGGGAAIVRRGPGRPPGSTNVTSTGGGGGRKGRRVRRSQGDIGRVVEDIISLLGKHAQGLRSEQIREALNLQAKELPRPLADGLADGRIKKAGERRATTYFVGEGGKSKRGPGRPKKKSK
jgi:hypothetical protein